MRMVGGWKLRSKRHLSLDDYLKQNCTRLVTPSAERREEFFEHPLAGRPASAPSASAKRSGGDDATPGSSKLR